MPIDTGTKNITATVVEFECREDYHARVFWSGTTWSMRPPEYFRNQIYIDLLTKSLPAAIRNATALIENYVD